jgi:triosephosphate isomerase
MRPLIAGNWKMHGLRADLAEIESIAATVSRLKLDLDILVCPPGTLIAKAAGIAGGRISIGGQDCHPEISGHHTGDISAEMLKDAGATAVIIGHSERRRDHGEFDALVAAKASAARRAGLLAIICVGETESQREAGDALTICGGQILASVPAGMNEADLAIGYEPLSAIGSGRMPTPEEIVEMHAHIRECLVVHLGPRGNEVRIFYGGSVDPADATEILALPEVGGVLVGGASLKAEDFIAIFESAPARVDPVSTGRLNAA